MFLALVFRNVLRNLPRLAPMIATLTVVFVLLVVGNAVLADSSAAFYHTFARHVAGDLSISAASDRSFTIFGSDALLVGEYLVPPTVAEFEAVREVVEGMPEVRAAAGVVSAAAQVRLGGGARAQLLFGVDVSRYRNLFDNLELTAGRWPAEGERALVLQADWGEGVIGQNALLAVAHTASFTLREVPVVGLFRYPVSDETLGRVALVDPDTARALNGYVYGAVARVEVDAQQQALLDSDLDDLFGAADADPGDATAADAGSEGTGAVDAAAIELAEVESFLADTAATEAARATIEGAWNYLLIGLHDPEDAPRVARALQAAGIGTGGSGTVVRDWRRTVGGTAQLVWFLQLLLNAGLLFVAFGAAVIVTNALVLSVMERTREIGTLRALGATRARVAALITAETVVVVLGGAVLGMLVGAAAVGRLNHAALTVDNRYLTILFGGRPLRGVVSPALVAAHAAAALALALGAVVYPIKRALGISPTKAMAE